MEQNNAKQEGSLSDINRREVLKSIGVTAAAGTAGISFSVPALAADAGIDIERQEVTDRKSTSSIRSSLNQRVANIVLEDAPVDSFNWNDPTIYEIRVDADEESHIFREVVVHSQDGDSTFNYVTNNEGLDRTATVTTGSGTTYRATVDDDGLRTEHIQRGEDVTRKAVKMLDRGNKKNKLTKNGVSDLNTSQASAYTDLTSGSTHLYVSGTIDSGKEALIIIDMNEGGDLEKAQVLAQGPVECFATCVAGLSTTIGWACWNAACGTCVAAPNPVSCGSCLACGGGVVGACATGCGAREILT
ncbi:hypothetical protein [Halocatena pleomorpha]|uniref:Uncharacterized protein n=1 Tax=Halocatena pleomorpha TaxID=1785090 RepID=A0A3P3R938_9EURY|nr:hypothetical protein [Halocatena pleomorpha]RRJ29977.1 hypothetical protein EIK79_11560 [Halocatena pleomorpha]